MPSESLQSVVFYALDKAIRSYRRMAQADIDRAGINITIDQWLVMRTILESDDLTQNEIAERVFKDQASVARILALLTKRGLLTAAPLGNDGRRIRLRITDEGHGVLEAVHPIVLAYRERALQGISEQETAMVQGVLDRITANCAPK